MKVHEYQAKEVFAEFGIPITEGRVAFTPDEAEAVAREIVRPVVIKAQVHIGGRGKAGGVKLADTPEEAREKASQILGMDIRGFTVQKVLVTEQVAIRDEYYCGITVDRDERLLVLILSAAGGVDIEQVAAETPEKIAKIHLDPLIGIWPNQIRRAIFSSGVDTSKSKEISDIITKLFHAFLAKDCSLLEINPLVVTEDGRILALDAKMDVDDNGLFRNKNLLKYREIGGDLDEYEAFAKENDVTYVHMPPEMRGPVGIAGNGAGLVMTTLDVVARAGLKPNDFCDIGGGGDAEHTLKCIETVLRDPEVKGFFLNVFGGITRCDVVAQALLDYSDKFPENFPVVVRLTGTNEDKAKEMLEGSRFTFVSTMADGANKIVELINALEMKA